MGVQSAVEPQQGKAGVMECQNCEQGVIPLGENFVSVEMCIDAGYPREMAGQSMGIEWGQCNCCYGDWQDCENCKAIEQQERRE